MPRDRLLATVPGLESFVNDALGLKPLERTLSGFEYVRDLLLTAVTNSYVETVAEHADSLHRAILATPMDRVVEAYLHRAVAVGARFDLSKKPVVLDFDHTDEDYYGKLSSTYLHAWTGEHAVTGKWKFLTCAIVNHDTPPKVPLLSLPTPIGYDVSKQIAYIIRAVRPLVGSIALTLYDRGFYTKPLMRTLTDLETPYLILVPKNPHIKRELAAMAEAEQKAVPFLFRYAQYKTTLALLKHIFNPRSKKTCNWALATNQAEPDFDHIIRDYKGRWRIETGFRAQDQARIASSSTEVQVRYFYFAFEQALQFAWGALYKAQAPYKAFLFQIWEVSKDRVQKEHAKGRPHVGAWSKPPAGNDPSSPGPSAGPGPDPAECGPLVGLDAPPRAEAIPRETTGRSNWNRP